MIRCREIVRELFLLIYENKTFLNRYTVTLFPNLITNLIDQSSNKPLSLSDSLMGVILCRGVREPSVG